MGSRLKTAISMRLAAGIRLIVAIGVLLSVADANHAAKPLTVKAHVGVHVNTGDSQSSGNTPHCLMVGETGCAFGEPCCEPLVCQPFDQCLPKTWPMHPTRSTTTV